MDQNRIDHVVRAPGTGRSRRSVLGAGAGLLAAAVGIGATRRAEAGWLTQDIAVYFVNATSGDLAVSFSSDYGNASSLVTIPPGGRNTFVGDTSAATVDVQLPGLPVDYYNYLHQASFNNPEFGLPWVECRSATSPISRTWMDVGQIVEGPNTRIERNSDGEYFKNFTFTVF